MVCVVTVAAESEDTQRVKRSFFGLFDKPERIHIRVIEPPPIIKYVDRPITKIEYIEKKIPVPVYVPKPYPVEVEKKVHYPGD